MSAKDQQISRPKAQLQVIPLYLKENQSRVSAGRPVMDLYQQDEV
jgi:hypothetical protein